MRTRRRALAASARGRVLDLGGADSHRELHDGVGAVDEVVRVEGGGDPELLRLARSDQTFDTVLSVFQLVSTPDLAATVGRLGRLVAPDGGRLLFLEPGRLAGWSGRGQRLVAPAVGLSTGWRVDRDIPRTLRDGGLSVISLERHRVPTVQWWLRHLLEGVAHHKPA